MSMSVLVHKSGSVQGQTNTVKVGKLMHKNVCPLHIPSVHK